MRPILIAFLSVSKSADFNLDLDTFNLPLRVFTIKIPNESMHVLAKESLLEISAKLVGSSMSYPLKWR